MKTTNPNPQERIAREVYHDAFLIVVDGHGTAHYWSAYYQSMVAVATDGSTRTFNFPPDKTIVEYVEKLNRKRGLETEPRLSASIVVDLDRAIC